MRKVDNIWSWVICGCCFFTMFFIQGTVRSSGLFYASIAEQWHINRVEASWPFNLCLSLEGIGIFLTGISGRRNIIAKGKLCAVILFTAGFALSGLANNILLLTALIGVVSGLCYGYIMAACYFYICYSFIRYRNIAMGIAVSGSTAGGIVLPYLHNFLMESYTLSQVFVLASCISLQAMPCVMLCRLLMLENMKAEETAQKKQNEESTAFRIEDYEESGKNTCETPSCLVQEENDISDKRERAFQNIRKALKKKILLLKHPVLYIFTISYAIIVLCSWLWFLVIVDVAKDKGFSQNDALNLNSAASFSGLVGRVCFGWFVDFGLISQKIGVIILIYTAAVVFFLVPHMFNIIVLFALSGCLGISTGSLASVRGSIPGQYFGINEMPFALGLNGILTSGISFLRPWLIGYIRDESGNYDLVFYIHGALMCFAGILWMMEPLAMKMHSKPKTEILNSGNMD